MTRECATPGCTTLTLGEICLGCMQRKAKAHPGADCCSELHDGDEATSAPPTGTP
jgi:hypothetical protein